MKNPNPNKLSRLFGVMFQRCCNIMMHMTEVLLFFIMVIITYEVVARYILKSPTLWVVDVSRYCLVYITFLGAAGLLLKGEHINVDLFLTHLSRRTQLILQIIGHLLCAITFLAFFIFSAATTWDHYRRGILVIDPIEIPKVIPLAIIPIGSFFLLAGAILRIMNFTSELKPFRGKEIRS
jgi:TRAP-type C4-dicarboxylate transport system permease small subunit